MAPRIEIRGGAEPEETAAITAVIIHLLIEEAVARARPNARPHQSAWVAAGRPRDVAAPLPSHTYESLRWAEPAEGETPG